MAKFTKEKISKDSKVYVIDTKVYTSQKARTLKENLRILKRKLKNTTQAEATEAQS